MNHQKWVFSGFAVAAFALAAAGIGKLHDFKSEQINSVNERELFRRTTNFNRLQTAGAGEPNCAKALEALKKPYLEDKESFAIFYDQPATSDHYRPFFKAALEACPSIDLYEGASKSTSTCVPKIMGVKPMIILPC